MKVFVALLCFALVAVSSGSPASNWLTNVSNAVNESISKATNIASEKGKEGLAKVQELIAQLQKQADQAKQDLQAAATEAQKATQHFVLEKINEQIQKLQEVEKKLSSWMGKN